MTAISSKSTSQNTATSNISFTIADAETTLACSSTYLSMTSSDTSIVANSSVVFGGTFPNCTAVITPVTSATGTTSITLTVSDSSSGTAQQSFDLTVNVAPSYPYALGQPAVTRDLRYEQGLYSPLGITYCSGKVIAADKSNHRVLVWNSVPTTFLPTPDLVLGQPTLAAHSANNGGVSASSMKGPTDVYCDGTRLFVVDNQNNRVLVWTSFPTTNGQAANFALGQPDLVSNTSNNGGLSASTLNDPYNVYSDGTRVFVADSSNRRVLVWSSMPSSSGTAANFALGQPDLVSNTNNNGGRSGSSLSYPGKIASNGTLLFVVDSNNHRVLVWNSLPTTSGQTADFALGQPDLTSGSANNGGVSASSLSYPEYVHTDGTRVFVADTNNNRVLVWSSLPSSSGQAASFALGQADLVSSGNLSVSATSITSAAAVTIAGTKLLVLSSNRVIIWNSLPTASGQAADLAIGQPDLATLDTNHITLSNKTIQSPFGIIGDGTSLLITDYSFNRILGWNSTPTSSNQAADFVLGQPNFTSKTTNTGGISGSTLWAPQGGAIVGSRLFIADSANHRVLVWNSIPATTSQAADYVLGQPNLTSNTANNGGLSAATLNNPTGVTSDGTHLFVVDSYNHRVLVWNSIPTSSGQAANFALGQPDLTSGTANNGGRSGSTMNYPNRAYTDGTRLFVSDNSNNRVLVWNSLPTSSGQVANFALGQPDLTSGTANNGGLSASTMSSPQDIVIVGSKLYVSELGNYRVLVWNTLPTASGQAASSAIGQSNLTSNTINSGGLSGTSLASPYALYNYGNGLFIGDGDNYRVLVKEIP